MFTIPTPPIAPLFPYTTLFRSVRPEPPVPGEHLGGLGEEAHGQEQEVVEVDGRRLGEPLLIATEQRGDPRSEEHTSELQSHSDLVCRLLLEKKNLRRFGQDARA